jgi:hypothetical protein
VLKASLFLPGEVMGWKTSFEEYLGNSSEAVRHSDRRCRLISYCRGRMLPIQCNDVNLLAGVTSKTAARGRASQRAASLFVKVAMV